MEEILIAPEIIEPVHPIQDRINSIEGEINELKALLTNTDWCVIKCQETGQKIGEVYPEESMLRSEARSKINSLQNELPNLYEALKVEKSQTMETDSSGTHVD